MEELEFPQGYVNIEKNISPNRGTENFENFMDLQLESCSGKKITSIGGGFGIFEMDAAKCGAIVTEVDPMFSLGKDEIIVKLNKNVNKFKLERDKQNKIHKLLEDKKATLNRLLKSDKSGNVYQEINFVQETEHRIKDLEDIHERILLHLDSWQKNQKKYGLILNGSSGTKIEGIDDNSQDFVLINHTLNHIIKYNEFGNWESEVCKILSEAARILKKDGKIWIVDYVGDVKELENRLVKYKNKQLNGSFSAGLTKGECQNLIKDILDNLV